MLRLIILCNVLHFPIFLTEKQLFCGISSLAALLVLGLYSQSADEWSSYQLVISKEWQISFWDTDLIRTSTRQEDHAHWDPKFTFSSYAEALESCAINQTLFLVFADLGGLSLAKNFYLTSIKEFNILNFLFISTSEHFCHVFQSLYVPCYLYANDTAKDHASTFGGSEFLHKMNIRTAMILEALKAGYNVIHSDVDVVFTGNPQKRILQLCPKKIFDYQCDMAALWDTGAHNAGFLFVRNTPNSIKVYQRMLELSQWMGIDDQKALNLAVHEMRETVHVRSLPQSEFLSGHRFFEEGHRTFAGDRSCPLCLVIHNNWIVSMDAKEYRFKEMHLWKVDDGQYYSDPHRKYIQYSNPWYFKNDGATLGKEKQALINALAIGQMLNRTIILPTFLCYGKNHKCTLLRSYKLKVFNQYFGQQYREHTFLSHPLVPKAVRSSVSQIYYINSTANLGKKLQNVDVVIQAESGSEITEDDVVSWFRNVTESVLVFHSLYDPIVRFGDYSNDERFYNRSEEALVKTKPMQF